MKNMIRGAVLFTVLATTLSSCMCYGPGYGYRGVYGGGPRVKSYGGHHHHGGGGYRGGPRHHGHHRR